MKPKTILITLCAGTLLAVLAATVVARRPGAAAAAFSGTRTFEVFGQIRSIDILNKTVRIAHEEVRDYMPAMVMPFAVKEAILLNGFAVNDRVKFQLTVTPDDSWISRIQKTDAAPAGESVTALAATPEGREADRVQTREAVPDFGLINQDGQAFRLRDFRGKAVLLTFIYTRCPIPNFCPLMSKNFAELQQRLSKEFPGRYQMLSISIDPGFDRPEVLKEYGGRYGAQGKDWSFATGDVEQIGFVAGLMGLYYAQENGLVSHDLRTAVISPEGRLVHLWKSNVWTPYEVQRVMRETLTGDADVAVR